MTHFSLWESESNSNLILLPNSPQAGSEMLKQHGGLFYSKQSNWGRNEKSALEKKKKKAK